MWSIKRGKSLVTGETNISYGWQTTFYTIKLNYTDNFGWALKDTHRHDTQITRADIWYDMIW